MPITFTTTDGPNTFEDFAVAIGIGTSFVPPQLGDEILRVFNIRNKEPSQPRGNFTLQVPLNKNDVFFYPNPGQYVITAGVMSGVGARYGAQVTVFDQTVELQW